MVEAIYAFMVGLSAMGWFVLILVWSTVIAAALALALQGDLNRRERRLRGLFDQMDGVADKLDEAVRCLKGPLPAWCPEEIVDKYRAEVAGKSRELAAAREKSDVLRVRLMRGKHFGSTKVVRDSQREADNMLGWAKAMRRKWLRSASVSVTAESLSVIEKRVDGLGRLIDTVKLPSVVESALRNDLSQIYGKTAIYREGLAKGHSVTRDGLIFLFHLSVELHQAQDLVVSFVSRARSASKG